MDTKSADAQVPSMKWHRSMHTARPPHPWIETVQVFIEKTTRVRGPAQFKPMFFNGQLHSRQRRGRHEKGDKVARDLMSDNSNHILTKD